MATTAENIQIALDATWQQIADLSATKRPSYNVDGEQMNWQEYFDSLMKRMEFLTAQLAATQPFEITTIYDCP